MYIALGIMLCGIVTGALFRRLISRKLISGLTLASIFLLLFLLGVAIGGNRQLLDSLPSLGLQAMLIMLFCVAGSIIFSVLITPLLKKGLAASQKKTNRNHVD